MADVPKLPMHLRHHIAGPGRIVRGHALLRDEHRQVARFTAAGKPIVDPQEGYLLGRAMCECGLMSEPGLGVHQARTWHQDHKRAVLGLD